MDKANVRALKSKKSLKKGGIKLHDLDLDMKFLDVTANNKHA